MIQAAHFDIKTVTGLRQALVLSAEYENEPFPLEGYTLHGSIGTYPRMDLKCSVDENGRARIEWDSVPPGNWKYDVFLISASNDETPLMEGTFTALPRITPVLDDESVNDEVGGVLHLPSGNEGTITLEVDGGFVSKEYAAIAKDAADKAQQALEDIKQALQGVVTSLTVGGPAQFNNTVRVETGKIDPGNFGHTWIFGSLIDSPTTADNNNHRLCCKSTSDNGAYILYHERVVNGAWMKDKIIPACQFDFSWHNDASIVVKDPTKAEQAANKNYVDSQFNCLSLSYMTLGTPQTVEAEKTFTGNVNINTNGNNGTLTLKTSGGVGYLTVDTGEFSIFVDYLTLGGQTFVQTLNVAESSLFTGSVTVSQSLTVGGNIYANGGITPAANMIPGELKTGMNAGSTAVMSVLGNVYHLDLTGSSIITLEGSNVKIERALAGWCALSWVGTSTNHKCILVAPEQTNSNYCGAWSPFNLPDYALVVSYLSGVNLVDTSTKFGFTNYNNNISATNIEDIPGTIFYVDCAASKIVIKASNGDTTELPYSGISLYMVSRLDLIIVPASSSSCKIYLARHEGVNAGYGNHYNFNRRYLTPQVYYIGEAPVKLPENLISNIILDNNAEQMAMFRISIIQGANPAEFLGINAV